MQSIILDRVRPRLPLAKFPSNVDGQNLCLNSSVDAQTQKTNVNGLAMTLRYLLWSACAMLLLLDACTSMPVDRFSAASSLVTTGGNTEKWQEIPMKVIQTKDVVYIVTYVRWDPVDQNAGTHDVRWLWYKTDKIVSSCTSKGFEFKSSPTRIWCRIRAAGLGVGHFRVEVSIDGKSFVTNEFDIVEVLADEQGAQATYVARAVHEATGGSESDKTSSDNLLAFCPNAIQVARDLGFPSEASDLGLHAGSVILSMVLTPLGSLKRIHILSSTDNSFNQAAAEAATRLQCNGKGLDHDQVLIWKMTYKESISIDRRSE
jgi:hypothetical protein